MGKGLKREWGPGSSRPLGGLMSEFDIKGRIQEMRDELGRSMGGIETAPSPYKWKPYHQDHEFAVGDGITWSDHFVETLEPNVYTPPRTLSGEIVHAHCGRFGWGIRVRLTEVPKGCTLTVGDVVFRWDTMMNHVKPVLAS